jgi:hydrogenase expression/formation protein HypC
MCLAVPGRVIEVRDDEATVDLNGNRPVVSTVLTPGLRAGQWVLVHAGFAIATVTEEDARATWKYLQEAGDAFDLDQEGGTAVEGPS